MVEKVVYVYPSAAGSPAYVEDDYDRIEFPEDDVPSGADFGVRINGDSMAPDIHDGDIVWVHDTRDVSDGQVGIFRLEDGAVCKRVRLGANGRVNRLASDNPEHEDIIGRDLTDLFVVGRVVGVYREE